MEHGLLTGALQKFIDCSKSIAGIGYRLHHRRLRDKYGNIFHEAIRYLVPYKDNPISVANNPFN
jgi:hypothetical protein